MFDKRSENIKIWLNQSFRAKNTPGKQVVKKNFTKYVGFGDADIYQNV